MGLLVVSVSDCAPKCECCIGWGLGCAAVEGRVQGKSVFCYWELVVLAMLGWSVSRWSLGRVQGLVPLAVGGV